jgi:cytochrome bd-type quinol oxidase subunit 1
MFIRAPISIETDAAVINNTNSISTYDIVYTQFQNFGLMLLYMAFAVAGVILFLWFVAELRNEMRARDQDESDNPQEE